MTRKTVYSVLRSIRKSKKHCHEHLTSASKLNSENDGDDISVASLHDKRGKMMKKFSKKRTILSIPGFRKNKKTGSRQKDIKLFEPSILEGEVLDYVHSPKSVTSLEYFDSRASNSGDDSSSVRSSISSLEALLVDNKRTSSIDSGIDCQPTSMSFSNNHGLIDKDMFNSKNNLPNKVKGRAPIASPEDDSLLEDPKSDLISQPKKTNEESCDNLHNNSSVSFGTLSDCSNCSSCSCDSCNSDSGSDSDTDTDCRPSRPTKSHKHSSDSDSDYRRDRSDGHSSDSDSSQCSDSFDDPKCYFASSRNSFLNSSTRSNSIINKSSANCVNASSVNSAKSKKLVKKASKSDKKSSSSKLPKLSSTSKLVKKLTGKLDKSTGKNGNVTKSQHNTSSVSLESSYMCVSPQAVKYQYNHRITSTPKHVNTSSSHLYGNKESAFVSFNSANQNRSGSSDYDVVIRRPKISYRDDFGCDQVFNKPVKRKNVVSFSEDLLAKDELIYKSVERKPLSALSNGNLQVKNVKLNRSASDVSSFKKPNIRTVPHLQNRNQQRSDTLINTTCDIDSLDTSKSPLDVKQAMEKTAFWIENNGYDSNPDEVSTKSLLKQNREVDEKELCDKIIGIYFSEESDSSLSSSCLDNSGDSNSSLSLSEEENVSAINNNDNELTLATFVPAPYQTLQATTRKIKTPEPEDESSPENSKLLELHRKKMELEKLKHKEAKLKEKIYNLSGEQPRIKTIPTLADKKTNSSHLCCDSRPTSKLSEQEIDTITKLHTICNGQRVVRYLNESESQMIIKHFPPPKSASRIIWDERLENADEVHHTPIKEPVKPRSILCQRSQNQCFPYEDDKPSPIVITRIRRSKSARRGRDWPW